MRFALSTNWNARRHTSGGALVDEVLDLGFDALELGYNTHEALVNEIIHCAEQGRIVVESVHNTCPMPISAPQGSPELYLMASLDEDERAMAGIMLKRTLDVAQRAGARAVVVHAGRIAMRRWFRPVSCAVLHDHLEATHGDCHALVYQQMLERFRLLRAKHVGSHMDCFCQSLEKILPAFAAAGIAICFENLPSFEAFPDAMEMEAIQQKFAGAPMGYWHDLGHGQLREWMGLESHVDTAKKLLPITRGVHIHDALPVSHDHLAPGQGKIDFPALQFFATAPVIKVCEPSAEVSAEQVRAGLEHMRTVWQGEAETTALR